MPEVELVSNPGAEVTFGPLRIPSKRQICWQMRANEPGRHHLVFHVDDRQIAKELVVGDGLVRVSAQRPGQDWLAILLHPVEKPFTGDSPITSLAIDYPSRASFTSGSDWWIIYFFIASIVFALIFKPFVNVRI